MYTERAEFGSVSEQRTDGELACSAAVRDLQTHHPHSPSPISTWKQKHIHSLLSSLKRSLLCLFAFSLRSSSTETSTSAAQMVVLTVTGMSLYLKLPTANRMPLGETLKPRLAMSCKVFSSSSDAVSTKEYASNRPWTATKDGAQDPGGRPPTAGRPMAGRRSRRAVRPQDDRSRARDWACTREELDETAGDSSWPSSSTRKGWNGTAVMRTRRCRRENKNSYAQAERESRLEDLVREKRHRLRVTLLVAIIRPRPH